MKAYEEIVRSAGKLNYIFASIKLAKMAHVPPKEKKVLIMLMRKGILERYSSL